MKFHLFYDWLPGKSDIYHDSRVYSIVFLNSSSQNCFSNLYYRQSTELIIVAYFILLKYFLSGIRLRYMTYFGPWNVFLASRNFRAKFFYSSVMRTMFKPEAVSSACLHEWKWCKWCGAKLKMIHAGYLEVNCCKPL